jgi:hypothetical protein
LSALIGASSGMLSPIVGEQHGPRAVQHPEHACDDAVIALIVIEAECCVASKVSRPCSATDLSASCWRDQAAAFPRQIENDAAAEVFEQRQSEPKLFPAVAAP